MNVVWFEFRYQSGNCGVSIVRSGEAMEQGLRDCCRSIRIGKILVESDAETHAAKVVYARFPDDIAKRQVLLMYPIMSTGNTVVQVCAHITQLQMHRIHQIISIFMTCRRWMFWRNMVLRNRQLFYRISFVLQLRPKRWSPHFPIWQFSHPNFIPSLQITLDNDILAQIKHEPFTIIAYR